MRKTFLTGIILFFVFSTICICYAGIRVKPHGREVLNPDLSYIMSETVVKDGRMVSDRIIERRFIETRKVAPPVKSKISKVLHRWGLRLLDMFVCNVDGL